MKHTKAQRMLSVVIAAVMALALLIVPSHEAFAASSYEVNLPKQMHAGDLNYIVRVSKTSTYEDIDPTSVKSSKPAVVKIKKETWKDENGTKYTDYLAYPKKAGKATLTIKFAVNGKTETVKHKITVKKYPNHIKSLKINGKKVKLSGTKRYFYNKDKFKGTKATIKIALKNGWKISSADGAYFSYKSEKTQSIKNVKKMVKTGKAISFTKKWDAINVWIIMKKGKEEVVYQVNLYR